MEATRVWMVRATSTTRSRSPTRAITRSPTRTGAAGFARAPLTRTWPALQASDAAERVLNRRTAHSQRSTRVVSTPSPSGPGEDDGPRVGDGDGVLLVRRPAAVDGQHRPAVLGDAGLVAPTGHEHRLDGQHHPRAQPQSPPRTALVGHRRVFMHEPADAVTTPALRDAAAARPGQRLGDIGAAIGAIGRSGGGADHHAEGRVTDPAGEHRAAVDAEQVAGWVGDAAFS